MVALRPPEGRLRSELAERVRLLVGQSPAPKTPMAVSGPCASPALAPSPRPRARSPAPRDGPQRLAPRATHEGRREPIRGHEEVGRRPALAAQATAVRGKLTTRDLERGAIPRQPHSALQRAIRTVRFRQVPIGRRHLSGLRRRLFRRGRIEEGFHMWFRMQSELGVRRVDRRVFTPAKRYGAPSSTVS